jgi:cytoskeletal protein CcmA (bactofilin family)
MSFFSSRRQSDSTPPLDEEQSSLHRPSMTQQPVGFETVLGANCTMEGVLRSRANVRLDGTFTGTLEIEGNVLVGETAKITADINAKNVSIAGAVRGNVSGKKVQLLRTGRIWGDIHATALTTEEGAFIDGKIAMMSHDAARVLVEPMLDKPATVDEPVEPAEPEIVDELKPIAEEAHERGLTERDALEEAKMADEGGIPKPINEDPRNE